MREQLLNLGSDKRYTFIGIFERTGFKREYVNNSKSMWVDDYDGIYKPTLLLTNVRLKESGELVTDHLWFNYTKQFVKLGELKHGDILQFNGRVALYKKGMAGSFEKDYKIERPTKITLLKKVNVKRDPIPDIDKSRALIGYIIEQNKQFYDENGRSYNHFYLDELKKWRELYGFLQKK